MGEKTKLGLGVLGAGLLLGASGDALLRATPWGLNVLLWVGLLAGAAFVLKKRAARKGEGGWALACAFAFACAFAWRDSPALLALDAAAILALLSVALLGGRGLSVRRAGVTDYAAAAVASAASALFAPLMLLGGDISWGETSSGRRSRHALAAVRGLLIAVPLVLAFGALFVSADAVYEGLVLRSLNLRPDLALSHIFFFLFLAWVSAGYLRGLFLGRARAAGADERAAFVVLGLGGATRLRAAAGRAAAHFIASSAARKSSGAPGDDAPSTARARVSHGARTPDAEGDAGGYRPQPPSVTEIHEDDATRPQPPSVVDDALPVAAARTNACAAAPAPSPTSTAGDARSKGSGSLGIVEVGVALGLLNALFFSFVAVQVRYFFGGAEALAASAGMTYSEYARRGFFELVWVAALVLPLLLAAHWLLRKENPAHERVFRLLSAGLLAMLFVVMASAVGRMRLYQSEYGQTELRFYTTAFMGWLAVVFVWFALTVLRGARERFAFGALVAALAVVGLLNAVNPNARIVRANAALAREGRAFDTAYAASLGADAAGALVEAAPNMSPPDRAAVALELLGLIRQDEGDWRSWNLSRARARRAAADNEALLREWALALLRLDGAHARAAGDAPPGDAPR